MAAETSNLSLVTPTQGTLSGTWGNTVNNGITEYTDIAIAGTLTLNGDGAVNLVNTIGSASATNIGSTTAQYAILKVTGTLTTTKVITAPSGASYSKTYVVLNNATGGSVTIKASGQTGVSIAVGESAYVYFNGTDYVKVATTTSGTGSVTSVAASVPSVFSITGSPITTSGTLAMTYSGTALPTTSGGTGLTSFTSGGVVYASSTSALATGSALVFDGTNLGLGVTPSAWGSGYKVIQLGSTGAVYNASGYTALTNNIYYNGTNNIYLTTAAASDYYQFGGTHVWRNAASGTAGNPISFTQAMTLDASGNLGLGTTSPTGFGAGYTVLDVYNGTTGGYILARSPTVTGQMAVDNSIGMYLQTRTNHPILFSTNNTEKARISAAGGFSVGTTADPGAGAIYATGNITAYYSSDIKFKENVRDIPDALATVNAIGGKLFDWKDDYIESKGGADGYFVQKADFGVVAQDVQKVFPIAVRTREDGSLAVDYEKLGALAFAALVELTKRVEALESK